MRFINDFDWKKTMQYGWRRILRALVRPFAALRLKFRRLSNPNTLVNTVVTDVQAEVKKAVSKKPESLEEYLPVGRYYAAKKLLLAILIAVILLPILYFKFVHPVVTARFLWKTIPVNTAEQYGYTGKVKLTDPETGVILYRGPLADGRITGTGTLYDYAGNILYKGQFENEMYEGRGTLFYGNGNVKYTGEFSQNQYQGKGSLYFEDETLEYEGGFAAGKYSGSGSLYDKDGTLIYEGSFEAGRYSGEGTLYGEKGMIIYEGSFVKGLYEGQGTLYRNGKKVYVGAFAGGIPQGYLCGR